MTGCLWTLNRGFVDVTRHPEPVTTTYVIDPLPNMRPLLCMGDRVRIIKGTYAGSEGTIQFFTIGANYYGCMVRLDKGEDIEVEESFIEAADQPKEAFHAIPC